MPQNDNISLVNKDLLKMYYDAQNSIYTNSGIYSSRSEQTQLIEDQSADFLQDYIDEKNDLTDDCGELMMDYISLLKQSKNRRIVKLLPEVERKFRETSILKHKEAEKSAAFIKSRFKILNNKKEAAKLSSKDMLLIHKLLQQDLGYSTAKFQDKLRSYAIEKINRTLKGEAKKDPNFDLLVQQFGTYQQKQSLKNKSAPAKNVAQENNPLILAMQDYRPSSKQQKAPQEQKTQKKSQKNPQEKKSQKKYFSDLWKKTVKWTKKLAVAAGLVTLGFFGGKFVKDQIAKSSDTPKPNNTEVTVKTPDKKTPQTTKDTQTADFSKEMSALEKAYKNRFDTSLEILLGQQKRDNLYQKIEKLAQDGKIQFKDGTTKEWYAHAFTMYNKIAPNSKENKVIKDLLAGKSVDKEYIHSLVIKAKRNGSGVSGKGSYSSFNRASKSLQAKHLKNRKMVKLAEQAVKMAKAQKAR